MVLSNVEVIAALKSKRLIIDPQPGPLETGLPDKCPYDTSAVDLKLGHEVVEFVDVKPPFQVMDLRKGGFQEFAAGRSKSLPISQEQPYHLKPGRFILAKTLEVVTLPLPTRGKKCLAARIEGKSSFARCGILVHFTAPTIHPGFDGTITLEIANLGPFEVVLYPEMYVCQLIIEEVVGAPFRNDSGFQGQRRAVGMKK